MLTIAQNHFGIQGMSAIDNIQRNFSYTIIVIFAGSLNSREN